MTVHVAATEGQHLILQSLTLSLVYLWPSGKTPDSFALVSSQTRLLLIPQVFFLTSRLGLCFIVCLAYSFLVLQVPTYICITSIEELTWLTQNWDVPSVCFSSALLIFVIVCVTLSANCLFIFYVYDCPGVDSVIFTLQLQCLSCSLSAWLLKKWARKEKTRSSEMQPHQQFSQCAAVGRLRSIVVSCVCVCVCVCELCIDVFILLHTYTCLCFRKRI